MNLRMLLSNLNILATAPGGVARLRELILTLAVQGKLVPQDPKDEPASELLKKIRAEKGRLIAAKALKREKDEPALTEDALPFDLPVSWTWAALGEVIDIVRGITFPATQKTREAAPGRIACLRTSNVQQTIEWEDLLFVDRSFMGREDQLIQHHDIVMSMANSRDLVGKVALIDHIPHAEATFGGFLGVLRPRKIDPRYAMAVLRTPYARSLLIDSSSQTTNIANVSLAKLRPLPFPLPPEAEQSRIVTRVEELMRLCDALEAKGQIEAAQHAQLVSTLLGTLTDSETPAQLTENWHRIATHFDLLLDRPEAVDALEQTILQLAVRGLLSTQAAEDAHVEIGERENSPTWIPPSWSHVSFEDVLLELRYGTSVKCGHEVIGTPVLRIPNLKGGRVDTTDLKFGVLDEREKEKLRLELGDLLIVRSNGSASLVGSSALVSTESEGFAFAGYLVRARFKREYVEPTYLVLAMQTLEIRAQIEAPIRTTSGVKNINSTEISRLALALPPLAEQSRIVTRVAQLRRLCADLRQRLTASQSTQAKVAESLIASV